MQRKEKMVPRGPGLQAQICRGLCDGGLALETLFLSERSKVARFSKQNISRPVKFEFRIKSKSRFSISAPHAALAGSELGHL